jgi:hypothetical protein
MLPELIPAEVVSYDRDARTCRVKIPGITDGGDVLPQATFCNPLGDKSEHTEIRIVPGDRVWLAFSGGDARYPIIVGYRPKETGNDTLWRRWHHENIDIEALDGNILIHADNGEVHIDASVNVIVTAPEVIVRASTKVRIESPLVEVTGDVVADCDGSAISLINHVHSGVLSGPALTGPPEG